jgi:hypothetical protein
MADDEARIAELTEKRRKDEEATLAEMERRALAKPTPTQAENDCLLSGIDVEKEDDGSEDEEVRTVRAMLASDPDLKAAYETRMAAAGEEGAPRRRGRPRGRR